MHHSFLKPPVYGDVYNDDESLQNLCQGTLMICLLRRSTALRVLVSNSAHGKVISQCYLSYTMAICFIDRTAAALSMPSLEVEPQILELRHVSRLQHKLVATLSKYSKQMRSSRLHRIISPLWFILV